jgi:septum formation protein
LLGLSWRAAPADVDEGEYLLADPLLSALNVAAAKARAVESQAGDKGQSADKSQAIVENQSAYEVILAADTLVVLDGAVLGKPAEAGAARTMLSRLRGRSHQVLTGVLLRAAGARQWGAVVSTSVGMRDYVELEIDAYVARGEPFDKAGGYAIQDARFRPVERVTGCYLNVVGLPLCAVAAGLAALGVPLEAQDQGQRTRPVPVPTSFIPPCGYCRAGGALVAK